MFVATAIRSAVMLAGLALGSSAFAQSTAWNWGSTPGCDPSTCTVNSVTATVSAYGAATSTSKFVAGTVKDVDPYGLGITSSGETTTSPHHSIDNVNGTSGGSGYAEALLISFTEAINLTQVASLWTYTDSDAMIFRWDGTAAVTASTMTNTVANSLPTSLPADVNVKGSGWTLVASGQFSTGSGAGNGSVNATSSLYSSYWLVSTALGQTTSGSNDHNDGFKVGSFTGNKCQYVLKDGKCEQPGTPQAPEPGSLALAAVAGLGLWRSRRKVLAAKA